MGKLDRKEYEALLEPLSQEMVAMARWAASSSARILVIFEGRDTAGKSGAIDAMASLISPRQCRTVALAKPSEREAGQWYFQRYVEHLPAKAEIVLFDRSWYNRAGVERVMGFSSEDQVRAFLAQAPVFEKQLIDDGMLLFKYWLCCDQEEQEERFAERLADPLKRWKLSPIDVTAREAMLAATHTAQAPWTLVDFNDQRRGRLTLLRNLLDRLPDTRVDPAALDFPPLGHAPHEEHYGVVEPLKSYKG